jgi:micrococcal nuclease
MKKTLTFISAALVCSFAANAQAKIAIEEASKHIGETVTVCSKVFTGRFIDNSNTKPTLLNLGAASPNAKLTVLINLDDRKNFSGKPEDDYNGKNVCVTGKVVDYKGKPEIVVSKPQDIQIQNDGGSALPEIRTKDFFWFE